MVGPTLGSCRLKARVVRQETDGAAVVALRTAGHREVPCKLSGLASANSGIRRGQLRHHLQLK